jgi:hypothetical protein
VSCSVALVLSTALEKARRIAIHCQKKRHVQFPDRVIHDALFCPTWRCGAKEARKTMSTMMDPRDTDEKGEASWEITRSDTLASYVGGV